MMDDISTNADTKELEMYLKHLVIKFVQCIVQSRSAGNKLLTKSKILLGPSTADWFNLALPDNSALLEEVRSLYGNKHIDLNQPLCIDIFLKTCEDETMVLEHWWLKKNTAIIPSKNESCNKVMFYARLITMLKSLLTVTRSLPGYNLARKQSSSMYKLYYRFKLGEPTINGQENYKQNTICKVSSLVGTVEINVAWRTKLLFAAKRTCEFLGDLKDDYFNVEPCPLHSPHHFKSNNNVEANSIEENYLVSALHKAAFGLPRAHSSVSQQGDGITFEMLLDYSKTSFDSNQLNKSPEHDVGIILESSDREEEDPINKEVEKQEEKPDEQNDFVMVELKAPFAYRNEELSKFNDECVKALNLSMFEDDFDKLLCLRSMEEDIASYMNKYEHYSEFACSLRTKSEECN